MHQKVSETVKEASYSVKEYQQNIEDLKLDLSQQIAN